MKHHTYIHTHISMFAVCNPSVRDWCIFEVLDPISFVSIDYSCIACVVIQRYWRRKLHERDLRYERIREEFPDDSDDDRAFIAQFFGTY